MLHVSQGVASPCADSDLKCKMYALSNVLASVSANCALILFVCLSQSFDASTWKMTLQLWSDPSAVRSGN